MKISTSNKRIKELLDSLSISQTEFCEKTKINKSALSNYLSGNRVPRQDQLRKIADAYDVSPAWLMGYDVPKEMPLKGEGSFRSDYFLWDFSDFEGHTIRVHIDASNSESFTSSKSEEIGNLLDYAFKCSNSEIRNAADLLKMFFERQIRNRKLNKED